MGGAVSSLDRQAVIRATEQPRFLMNSILDYIIKNIRENDVFRMQDPSVCKEFLLLSADSLDRLFKHIDVNPQTDRSGKIYFERVGRLTSPAEGSPAASKRKLTCLAIAYFYVRILQIYLALAFTLIDDPALVPGRAPPALGAFPGNRAILPGREVGVYQRGGAGEDKFTFSNLIEKNVLVEKTSDTLAFVSDPDLIINRDSSDRDRRGTILLLRAPGLGQPKVPSKGAVLIRLKSPSTDGAGRTIPARIFITSVWKLQPEYIAGAVYGQPMPGLLREKEDEFEPNLQLDLNDNFKSLKSPYKYRDNSELHKVFKQLIKDLEDPSVGTKYLTSSSTVARREVARKKREEGAATEGVAAKAAARVTSDLKEGTSEKALRFQESVKLISSVRPLAHCIGRSFQLLDVDALGSKIPKSARTHICQSKFETGSGGYLAAPPGSSIADIPGLKAMNFLFFVLEQVIHLSGKTEPQLRATLSALSEVYGGKPLATPKVDIDTMATIRPRPVERCSGTAAGQARYLNPGGISIARGGVGRLWSYQRAHAAKVEAIFKKLFDIRKSGSQYALAINENLFNKGIPEVEKISDEARDLLTGYYGECEQIYQDTVKVLTEDKFDTARETAERGAAAVPKK
jgi:hypothetical protein